MAESPTPYTVPIDPTQPALPSSPSGTWITGGLPSPRPSSSPRGFEIPLPDGVSWDDADTRGVPDSLDAPSPPADEVIGNDLSSENESLEQLPPPVKSTEPVSEIAEAIESGQLDESPPLQEEVIRWYQYPLRWMRGWNSHAEFGLDGSDGNADTLAIQTGLETKRKTDRYTLALDLDYRQASNRNVTTANNGRFNVDYDRLLGDSNWTGFAKYGMEWDRFKAFDLRLNVNGGLGYYWINDDTTTLATRFGAGASREIGAPIDDWIPEAVFGLEAERQLTSHQKLKGKIDYFPAWEDFGDYRIVTDLSWEILLDGTENLSLKLAATDRYDSTPQGAKPNDLYYSLLLLYKF